MTPEELKEVYEGLKAQGKSDEDIVAGLGKLFEDGEISKDELKALIEPLGYEFTPEFEKMGDDAPADDPQEPKEGVTEAEAEESEDEGEEAPEQASETKPADEDPEEEKRKAFSAMGLN